MHHDHHNASCTSIAERIRRARSVEERYGEALRGDAEIRQLMERLETQLSASLRTMIDVGIVAACTRCDEKEGGSCCGAGIEERYGETILLLNLLFGVELPRMHLREDSCFFLGDHGCVLRVRDVLCVNYLCRAVQEGLSRQGRDRLQEAVGAELSTVFELQEAVLRLVRAWDGEGEPLPSRGISSSKSSKAAAMA